jgi:hypothetical protein
MKKTNERNTGTMGSERAGFEALASIGYGKERLDVGERETHIGAYQHLKSAGPSEDDSRLYSAEETPKSDKHEDKQHTGDEEAARFEEYLQ